MASSKEYLGFVLDRLSLVEKLTFRAMMGEYILYVNGKVVGGIYDDRLLIKDTNSVKKLIPDASYELAYEGAKPMLSVKNEFDKDFLARLFNAAANDLMK